MKARITIVLGLLLAVCLMLGAAGAEGVEIRACEYQTNGLVRVEWSSDIQAESFQVASYDVLTSAGSERQVQSLTVEGNTCEMYGLPGRTMRFVVQPSGSEVTADTAIIVPLRRIDEFKVTSSIQLKRSRGDKSTRINSFSASDLQTWIDDILAGRTTTGDLSYDVRFNFRMPKLGRERVYNVMLVMEAPDGSQEIMMYDAQSEFMELSTLIDWYYDFPVLYSMYVLYTNHGSIPSGNYQVNMYYDGRLATGTTFKVDN